MQIFVQVDDADIARFERDFDSVEELFHDGAADNAALLKMSAAAERLRTRCVREERT